MTHQQPHDRRAHHTHEKGNDVSPTHDRHPTTPHATTTANAETRLVVARCVQSDTLDVSRPKPHRWGRGVLLALTTLMLAGVTLPGAALALPAERVYEMVSPVYKGGYGVRYAPETLAVAANGESAAYSSAGAFAGAPAGAELVLDYLARRTGTGWSTLPLLPPAAVTPGLNGLELSSTLESVLALGKLGPNAYNAEAVGPRQFFLHSTGLPDTNASWESVGPPLENIVTKEAGEIYTVGASLDLCHILVAGQAPLVPEVVGFATDNQAYEIDRGCDGSPASSQPKLIALNDQGKLINRSCGEAELGDASHAPTENTFNAISADGSEVFFTDCLTQKETRHQLFVRLGGTRTLEVSKPLGESDSCAEESSCEAASKRPSADFAGASEDGSRVYFTTTAALTGEDKDQGNDLYMAGIGCPEGQSGCEPAGRQVRSLVQVSHDPSGGEAGVQGVVRVAPDGSRAYFVATGDLLTADAQQALAGQGRPVPHAGADNLYVYDTVAEDGRGSMTFIGDLCSGPQISGAVEDEHCPSNLEAGEGDRNDVGLWRGGGDYAAQTAGTDGRFLVFSTYAQLAASDTNSGSDVYRYDAQTGGLDRVSLGENGYDTNGNGGSFDAQIPQSPRQTFNVQEQQELGTRAISEDGSRIVFGTSAPLSPAATNGLEDLYEWHEQPGGEGSVSLISSGSAEEPIRLEGVAMSPSGSDIFFLTSQGLVPQDTDGLIDLYDARIHGGFPAVPSQPQPCAGDACQGPLTSPAPLLVPGSVSQAPGENIVPAGPTSTSTSKHKAHGKGSRNKKRKPRKRTRSARHARHSVLKGRRQR